MTSPVADVLRAGRPLLTTKGWRKAAGPGSVYLRELRPGVRAWLALSGHWSRADLWLDLRPGLGVRHDSAERWAAQLRGVDPVTSSAPTVMGHLASSVPARSGTEAWRLHADSPDDNATTWQQLVEDVEQHAAPWWRSRTSDEQLVASIRRGEGNDTARLVLPLLLISLGRPDDARRAVEAGRGRRTGLVVDYDAYAAAVLSELEG